MHTLVKTQVLHLLLNAQAPRVDQRTPAGETGRCGTPCGQAELTCITTHCLQGNSPT